MPHADGAEAPTADTSDLGGNAANSKSANRQNFELGIDRAYGVRHCIARFAPLNLHRNAVSVDFS